MKKIKLFFALFAMLALNVGNAWGAEASFTIKFKDNGSDASTALTTATFTNQVAEGTGLIKSVSTSYCYAGTGGLKCSSNKQNGTFTLTLNNSYTISKIVLSVKNKNATTKTVKVGNTSFSTSDSWNTTSFEDLAFTGTETTSDQITVSLAGTENSKRVAYIASMTVYYKTDEPGSTKPAVKTLKSIAVTGMTTTFEQGDVFKFDGTCTATYSVTKDGVAQADETVEVTPTSVSAPDMNTTGDKVVTVSYTENEVTVETTYTITVTENTVTAGTYSGNLNNTFFGCSIGSNSDEQSSKFDDIMVVAGCASSATNKTNYQSEHVRFYADSYLTLSVPTGYVIKSIVFTEPTSDKKWGGSITVSAGTYTDETKSWAGNAQEVKFSFAAQNRIASVKVTYIKDVKYALNITEPAVGTGTLVVKDGETELTSGAEIYEGTKLVVTPTPAHGYVLDALTVTDASSNAVTVTDNKFTMPASDVTVSATFKVNEKPAATLTLSKNGVAETFPGLWKQDDVVILPSITSDCVKKFVGWSANPTCNVAPEYKEGEEYTLTSTTQTLYAVYAKETAGAVSYTKLSSNAFDAGATYIIAADQATDDATLWYFYSCTNTDQNNSYGYLTTDIANNAPIQFQLSGTASALKIREVSGAKRYLKGLATGNFQMSASEQTLVLSNTGHITNISGTDTYALRHNYNSGTGGLRWYKSNTGTYAYLYKIEQELTYSNYSTTCTPAPKAEVNPTKITATATGVVEGKVTVTYENVNTEDVAVALFNDEACTEAFSADWLTASLDGEKNVTYTIKENTTYAERKAYIQLTAPETTGATEPAVVVIPINQAAKEKVFTSLEALLAAITPTTEDVEVTVTLTNEVIQDFYKSGSNTNGIYLNVPYQGGTKQIEIYCNNVPAEWVKGGKVSGKITCPWKLYNSTWELCPEDWTGLEYTAPATVKSIAVSGTPTKTTYVDGEAFDPTGLVVTATLTDDSKEPIYFALVDWTFDPETLSKGETSVSVVATYNTMASAAYEVTGLTVNEIPTKTIAEFIAAGGGRCYLEGIVNSLTEGNSMKYGNFDLTDASGTIYVYGCLNGAGESQKFAELGVKNGDKIKVIADQFKVYDGKDQAKNVRYVSHISAATITIADITMEVGETKTISATITPAEAETAISYEIKENTDNAISLSGNTITALAEGTATITATIPTAAEYMSTTIDFTVTVKPKSTKDKVVILAKYDDKWYAMMAQYVTDKTSHLAALPVTYIGGTLYNVADENKPLIEWERAVVDGKATFSNGSQYLTGVSGKVDLTLDATACEWTISGDSYLIGSRTFLYNAENNWFRNFATSNADAKNFSGMPVVTAPVYATSGEHTRTVPVGYYATVCLPNKIIKVVGATLFEVAGKEGNKVIFDEVITPVAGMPYIFLADENTTLFYYENGTEAEPGNYHSLHGTFEEMKDGALDGMYMVQNNKIVKCAATGCTLPAHRAYFDETELGGLGKPGAQMPGRRRITMGTESENEATGTEDVVAPAGQTIKVIINGQLIIIRDGEKYNAQGVRL